MCIMGRDEGNTVKTPAHSEDGVTVDPINPNPGGQGSRAANRNRVGNVRSRSNPKSGASRAKAAAKSRRSSKGTG